jgi:hypothetical protein
MTEIIEQAFKKLSSLPREKQELIASLIMQEIERENKVTTDREMDLSLPPSVGMGKSGRKDISQRCDELLWKEE